MFKIMLDCSYYAMIKKIISLLLVAHRFNFLSKQSSNFLSNFARQPKIVTSSVNL